MITLSTSSIEENYAILLGDNENSIHFSLLNTKQRSCLQNQFSVELLKRLYPEIEDH